METNKRGWIKNAIIIFLVIMLILTLFSNTFMNRSLPEVAVQNAESGSITTQVKLSGSVNANTTKSITLEYARKIDTVLVRRGDTVEPGTVLATLVKGESDEIDQLEIELKQLQIEYKKLQVESVDSLTAKRYELEDTQRELVEVNDYIASYPALNAQKKAYEDQIAVLEGQVKEKEAVINDLKKQMAKLTDSGMTFDKLGKAISEAEDVLKDAERKTKITQRTLQSSQTAFNNSSTLYTAAVKIYNDATAKVKTLTEELEALKAQLGTLKDERDTLQDKVDELAALPTPTPEEEEELAQARIDLAAKKDAVRAKESEISAKEAELAAAKTAETEAKAEYDTRVTEYGVARTAYTDAQNDYSNAVAAEKSASKALDTLNDGWSYAMLDERKTERDEELTALNDELTEVKKTLEDFEKENITTALDDAEDKQRTLNRSVESLTEQIRIAEANGSIDDETAALNLQIKRSEMQKKQREIEKLREKAVTTELKSTVNGTISTVGIAAGDEVAAGTTVMEITVSDGFTMECSVTNAQASRLRVGQTAEVQYYYWGDKPNVYISTIKNDPNNSGKGKLVTFTVEGDIADGTSLTVTVGGQGSSYDCIVPNSAIREDSDGKFILVVTSKSSPLGNRYYASRQNVTVLASDATRSAIDATLSWGDYVITGASVPISDGMQVRMSEK